jgi:DHA1 family bicyclomycin/chloramphenicol resistance-like MFS transporter
MTEPNPEGSHDSTTLVGVMAGAAVVVAQMASYVFTPAFPQLVQAFHSPPGRVQLTISAYLLGYAITQLFCGPISEKIGRRKVLLGALALFVAGNLACAAAPSLELLLLFLFFTALGSGGLPTMGQSVLHDVYGPEKISKAASYLVTALAATPILSPLVGGHIAQWLGWREVFVMVAAMGALLFVGLLFILKETHPPGGDEFSLTKIFRIYVGLLRNRDFVGYVLLVGLAMSGFVLFFSGAPFIFQLNLKMSPDQYGLWFLLSCLGYPAGSLWSHRLMDVMPLRRLGFLGVGLLLAGSGLGAMLSYWTGPSLYVLVPTVLVFTLGLGICVAVGRGGALASLRENVGFGAGMMGFLMILTGSVINAVGSRLDLVRHQRVALAIFICSCLALLASFLIRNDRAQEQRPGE